LFHKDPGETLATAWVTPARVAASTCTVHYSTLEKAGRKCRFPQRSKDEHRDYDVVRPHEIDASRTRIGLLAFWCTF